MDEFDEDFRECLERTILSDRLPDEICTALRLDNQSTIIKPNYLRKLIFKINQVSFGWLCDVMRLNLLADNPINFTKLTMRQKLDRLLHDRTRKSCKFWPFVVFLVYFLCIIKISFEVYFQYNYDANMAKLKKLQELLVIAKERNRLLLDLQLDVYQLQRDFETRAREAYQTLELMGAAYRDWPFINQAVMLLCFQTSNWAILFSPCSYVGDWVWLTAKAILDQDNERRTRFRITLDELHRFARDSWSFFRVKFAQSSRETTNPHEELDSLVEKVMDLKDRSLVRKRQSKEMNQQHYRTIGQLKMIALEGRLNALHRTPSGRDKLALANLLTVSFHPFYTNFVMVSFFNFLRIYFNAQGKRSESTTFKDTLGISCVWIFIEILILMGTFLCPIFVYTVYDLIEEIKHLKTLIMHVIVTNERRCRQVERIATRWNLRNIWDHQNLRASSARMLDCHPLHAHAHARAIELDLLMVIIQCRIVMRSYALVKPPLTNIATMIIYFAISVPIGFCIHSAYFSPGLKLVTLSGSLASTSCCLCLLLPLGLLYTRIIRTNETIWSLVAQLSYFETVAPINKHLKLESSVALFTLRRHVTDMKFSMDKYAIRWNTMPITYGNLIRILSWILLFMAAGSSSVKIFGEGLGSIMNDPFYLFKFLKIDSST